MRINTLDLSVALRALEFLHTLRNSELPEGLKYIDTLDARTNIAVTLKLMNVEVKNA